MQRPLVAVAAVAILCFGSQVSWAKQPSQSKAPSTPGTVVESWQFADALDGRTMQTDLMEGQLHADSRGRKPTRPFTTWVHTAEPCTAYTAVFYDGRPTRIGNSPPGPEFGTGGFDLSEDPGETYDQYLVDPRAIDPVTHRWPRKWQQDTCKPLRAAAQERANHNLLVRRVQDLFVLPEPGLALVPERSGITGLPIRLWAADIPSDVLRFPPTVLEGKRIEIEARPLSFEWDTGDTGTSATQWRYSTPAPGSAEQPAVTHVYETKSSVGRPGEGVYTIKLTVRWARRYRVVGKLRDTERS